LVVLSTVEGTALNDMNDTKPEMVEGLVKDGAIVFVVQ
jgi:hypothetical protein